MVYRGARRGDIATQGKTAADDLHMDMNDRWKNSLRWFTWFFVLQSRWYCSHTECNVTADVWSVEWKVESRKKDHSTNKWCRNGLWATEKQRRSGFASRAPEFFKIQVILNKKLIYNGCVILGKTAKHSVQLIHDEVRIIPAIEGAVAQKTLRTSRCFMRSI